MIKIEIHFYILKQKEQGKILDGSLNLQGEFQDNELRSAIAQIILTNRQQENIYGIINKVAVAYVDIEVNDILHYATWDDNSVMGNNDINWRSETPSQPTQFAIENINGRLKGKITTYKNEEIKEFYKHLYNNEETNIQITLKNIKLVFEYWKQRVKFNPEPENEKKQVYLFITDLIKGTRYEKDYIDEFGQPNTMKIITDKMDLSKYKLSPNNEEPTEIKYFGNPSRFYEIKNIHQYKQFWKTYNRPPHKNDFKEIHEHINILYTDAYRRTSGAEYTPPCFVKKQNELLNKYYGENWQDEYIVYDPCCGVGNLEDDFPEEYIKNYCFLSTLEQMDIDRCKSKGFKMRKFLSMYVRFNLNSDIFFISTICW